MTRLPRNPPASRAGLNLGLALRAWWPPLVVWIVVSAAMVALSYPPLLCVTPLAWALALYSGWAAGRGASPGSGWVEAGVAGGALGLAQGLLFGLYNAVVGSGGAAAAGGALLRGLGIGLGSLAGCAMLALLAAAWSRRAA